MEFEWDENKRQSNLSQHGIDFVRATKREQQQYYKNIYG
jgi:uncharacterized DUF497 family protein